jgi:hypothetical protein
MAADLPEGFRYEPELIGRADEAALLAFVRELPFRDFEFHGYTGKRRVVSFGWHYDFSARHLRKADGIPRLSDRAPGSGRRVRRRGAGRLSETHVGRIVSG